VIEIKKIHDSRIKIIKLRYKKGGNYARNKGIRIATGEFIAFLDSDDIFYNDKLEKQIKNLKNKKADFDFCKIYVRVNITYSINFILPNRNQEQSIINGDIFEELTKDNFISTQAILVKKKVMEKFFFDINLPRLQDYDFLLRIIPKVKVSFTNEILVDINIQKDSISNSLIKLQKAIKIILNKDYNLSHIQKNNIKNYLNYLKMSS
jgi:glycosyltransferase involved in cell wall biosynthesis